MRANKSIHQAVRRERMAHLLIIWAAVAVALLTTACSKSGGGRPLEQTPPPAETPAPSGETQPPAQGELDGDSGQPSTDPAKPVPDARPGSEQDGDDQLNGGNGVNGDAGIPIDPGVPSDVPSVDDPIAVVMDPAGLTPDEIYSSSAAQGEVMPGGKSDAIDFRGSDLYFTGSGQDTIREQLLTRLESKPDGVQKRSDRNFAKKVKLVRLVTNERTKRMEISVHIMRQGGSLTPVSYSGFLDRDNVFRGGDDLRKGNGIRIEAVCMDREGTCGTVVAKVQEKRAGRLNTAYVIQRETPAALYIEGNGFSVARNLEYNRLLDVLWGTVRNPEGPRNIRELTLVTTETVQGTSEFEIRMIARTNYSTEQSLGWYGPLVKPQQGIDMDLSIGKLRGFVYQNGRPVAPKGMLADTIRDTRLVRNDGRGNLQLDVIVRRDSLRSEEDRIRVTVARKHKAVRSLRVL